MQRVEVYSGYDGHSRVATDAQALQVAYMPVVVVVLHLTRPRSGQNSTSGSGLLTSRHLDFETLLIREMQETDKTEGRANFAEFGRRIHRLESVKCL